MNAVVTGGTKGIGKAIVLNLAENGFNLAVCSRNEKDLQNLKTELEEKHPNGTFMVFKADMSSKAETLQFADHIKQHWNQLDILVNNAGIYFPGAVHSEEDGVLEQLIETNLYSAYYLTRALLPMMIDQGNGHVFNMCSIASIIAYPNSGSYSISKFALLGFSKVLREEMKEKGIRVTAIMPGATWSSSWEGIEHPQERLMKANDIAKALWGCYQLSDQAVVEELVIRPQLGDI